VPSPRAPFATWPPEIGLTDDDLELYGPTKAKVTLAAIERLEAANPRGRYVLVTAITPTPLGEGKTTTTIGLTQGLNRIGKRAAAAIRQPSLGPVFGIKGGRGRRLLPGHSDGGLNLHLTGDVHAIGAAHNLAAAFLDNSLHHRNPLGSTRSGFSGRGWSTSATGPCATRSSASVPRRRGAARDRVADHGRLEVMAILALAGNWPTCGPAWAGPCSPRPRRARR